MSLVQDTIDKLLVGIPCDQKQRASIILLEIIERCNRPDCLWALPIARYCMSVPGWEKFLKSDHIISAKNDYDRLKNTDIFLDDDDPKALMLCSIANEIIKKTMPELVWTLQVSDIRGN